MWNHFYLIINFSLSNGRPVEEHKCGGLTRACFKGLGWSVWYPSCHLVKLKAHRPLTSPRQNFENSLQLTLRPCLWLEKRLEKPHRLHSHAYSWLASLNPVGLKSNTPGLTSTPHCHLVDLVYTVQKLNSPKCPTETFLSISICSCH